MKHSPQPRIPRYTLITQDDGRVRLTEARSQTSAIFEGILKNISGHGALVIIQTATAMVDFLQVGENLKIELAIPDRGRFAFFATVKRLDPAPHDTQNWELGLEFHDLPKALKKTLDGHITLRTSDFSHPDNYKHASEKGFIYAELRTTKVGTVLHFLRRLKDFFR